MARRLKGHKMKLKELEQLKTELEVLAYSLKKEPKLSVRKHIHKRAAIILGQILEVEQ